VRAAAAEFPRKLRNWLHHHLRKHVDCPNFPTPLRPIDMDRETDLLDTADNLTLAELMQEPLVHLVMRSDGVDRASIEALLARIAHFRGQAPCAGSK
jgi:hypothetical protein